MNKYSEIEIQTAKNLLKEGYKWLTKNSVGTLYACKKITPVDDYTIVSNDFVPIFESIKCGDDLVSLEAIVHPQILDDAERRYLSAVIRPFRNRVTGICKRGGERYEYLRFNGRFNWEKSFYLPNFKAGTMYKDMEPDRWYTLEELGL